MNDNMTSFYAKSADPLTVVFVVYPDIVLLDLVGPLQSPIAAFKMTSA